MLRRWAACLLALLLLSAVLPASAEEQAAPDFPLYRLIYDTEQGPVTTGTAVLFASSQTLLTSYGALSTSGVQGLYAEGPDGRYAVANGYKVGKHAVVMLQLAEPSTLEPIRLSAAEPALCLGALTDGQLTGCMPSRMQTSSMDGLPAVELALVKGLLPGAVLAGNTGLQGLVLGSWGEGADRYLLLPADTLLTMLTQALEQEEEDSCWISDRVAVSQQGCLLTVDWSACGLPEDWKLCVYLMNTANPYYQISKPDVSLGSLSMPICPGDTYGVWVYAAAELPEDVTPGLEHIRLAETAAGVPYTELNYRDEAFFLAMLPEGTDAAQAQPEPYQPTTRAAFLSDGRPALHVASVYETEETHEYNGILCLTTPEGYRCVESAIYTLAPEYLPLDAWTHDLSNLFATYLRMVPDMAPGDYTLCIFYEDQPVSSLTFTLE